MKNIWNAATKKQREDLLKSIYGDCYIMFASECEKDWDSVRDGVRNRLGRLHDVYAARNAR